MGSDERDLRFDKALSRHLRASHGAAEAALQRGSCPDAETLAAYHERSLLPEELNSWKEHIVGCAHCQVILAQLESSDQIPLEAADKEEALALKESVAAMAAQNLEALPAAVAPSKSQPASEARLREKTRPFRLSSGECPITESKCLLFKGSWSCPAEPGAASEENEDGPSRASGACTCRWNGGRPYRCDFHDGSSERLQSPFDLAARFECRLACRPRRADRILRRQRRVLVAANQRRAR